MGVGVPGVGGPGGGGVGRGSGVCLCGGVVGWLVCWVRCRPVRCAMARAGFQVGPVLLLLGWLPAVDRAQARRVVLGVAGSLWGSGPVSCAGVRCRGVARVGYPPPPYLWGWVGLRARQVMPGVAGSLWPCGVVLVVDAPPVWTHALVGGSVACRP